MLIIALISCNKDDENLNTAPKIIDQTFNVSEKVDDNFLIGKVLATDAENDDLQFSVKTNDANLFEISESGDLSLASGKSLDHSNASKHDILVSVTDGNLTNEAKITIEVINENDAPKFNAQTFSIAENSSLGSLVGTLAASDPDGDNITYSWAQGSNVTAFELFTATGEIKLVQSTAGNLDYESKNQYKVSVTASDGVLSTTAEITVNVTNVNETPVFTAQSFSIAENSPLGSSVGTLSSSDPDGDNITYSWAPGGNVTTFTLNTATGEIKLMQNQQGALDYETKNQYKLNISSSDGTLSTVAEITINVTDVAESSTTVSTALGTGFQGNTDSAVGTPKFTTPTAIVFDSAGYMYIADTGNRSIRRKSPNGTVITLTLGALRNILSEGLAIDSNDNLYVSDFENHKIYKVSRRGGSVSLFAGSTVGDVDDTWINAKFRNPAGLYVDGNDNVFVADYGNNKIRKISPNRVVTTYAGNGSASSVLGTGVNASLNRPYDITGTTNGNIYVTEDLGNRVVKISPSGSVGFVRLLAGSGTVGFNDDNSTRSSFNRPTGIVTDNNGNIYVADALNNAIRKITSTGTVTSISRNGRGYINGNISIAKFYNPKGLAIDADGNLYVGDYGNHSIRKITF